MATHSWWNRRRETCECNSQEDAQPTADPPVGIQLSIEGMRCSHCQDSVDRALREISGVSHVSVDLEGKRATIEGRDFDAQALVLAVTSLGYKARVADPSVRNEDQLHGS